MDRRKKIIMLTYSMILIILVTFGLTLAFFIAIINNDEGSSIIIQTADMRLLFIDADELRLEDILPGSYVEKQFEVKNIGNTDATYNIRWKGIYNEFINNELILNLECTAYNSRNTSLGSCGSMEDIVGYTTSGAIKANIPIATDITHRYTITITFIETGENQNYNQGKSFNGTLLIDTLDLNMTSIKGILVDQDNNILANKIIEVHSDPISTTTNSKGEFLIEGIPYGEHELIIKDNNSIMAKKDINIATTNNNSSISDSTSIYWNDTQKSVIKVIIETNNNEINKIDINWIATDSRCFAYDNASTTITDYYCYQGNDKGLPTITDIIIPNTVTAIGAYAFQSNKLTSVIIPDSVTTIGNSAFIYNQLTNVTLPNSINTLVTYAFYSNQLESIIIPDSVISIGTSAFGHNKLKSVTLGNSVSSLNGFGYNQLESLIIPDSVTSIGSQAFISNELTSLTIGNNVISIGYSAFQSNKLTSVTIPNSVNKIDYAAFKDNKITKVNYTGGINMSGGVFNGNPLISDESFYYYKNKDGTYDKTILMGYISDGSSSVIIPDHVKTIKDYAFTAEHLIDVKLSNNLVVIGNDAFSQNRLTSLVIPDSVTSISWNAFKNNLLNNLTIGNSVSYIGANAFANNKLTNVTIPNSITSITSNSFASNPNLTLISIDNVSGSISGSPWGATNATIQYLKDS